MVRGDSNRKKFHFCKEFDLPIFGNPGLLVANIRGVSRPRVRLCIIPESGDRTACVVEKFHHAIAAHHVEILNHMSNL